MNTTSLSKELLEFMACPLTHQSVRLADDAVLGPVNERIRAGACQNASGTKVAEPLGEALVTEDGKRLYPVREGIPVMLVDESIVL